MVSKAGVRSPEVVIPQFSRPEAHRVDVLLSRKLTLAQILVSTLILVGRSSKLVPTPQAFTLAPNKKLHTDTCTVLLISQCGPELSCALQKFRKFLLLHAALGSYFLKEEGKISSA